MDYALLEAAHGHLLENPLIKFSNSLTSGVRTTIIFKGLIKVGRSSKAPPKEISSPLGASLDHLWATPPSHRKLQKVRGFVVGFH
jgi:hypothetical protein